MRSVQTLLVHIMSVSTVLRQGNMVFNTDRGKSHSDIVIYDRVRTIYSLPFAIFYDSQKHSYNFIGHTPPPPIILCRLKQETQLCIASTIEINLQQSKNIFFCFYPLDKSFA